MVVVGQLGVGGTEQHLAQVLPRLSRAGFDVQVFALKAGGAIAGRLLAGGVPVLAHLSRRDGWVGVLQAAWRLRQEMRRRRPQIVHFFLPAAYLIGVVATLGIDVRRVMSRRSLANYQARYPGVRLVERLFHRHMYAVLANSRAVAAELLREGVPRCKLGLIYNGVEDPTQGWGRETARRALAIGDETLVFVTVANLIQYKGHADLLDALASAQQDLGSDWLLLCAGRDDGIGAELKARAQHLGIAACVRWLGQVQEVGVCLAAADVGVLASHEEGFSNAVLEGMAAGLPMLVTNVGGNAEAVLDEDCGLVVPAHDVGALAMALRRLSSTRSLRQSMGQRGRARAAAHFSIDICVANYERLYGNLATGSSAAIPSSAEYD